MKIKLILCVFFMTGLYGCVSHPQRTSESSFIDKYRRYDYCRLGAEKQDRQYSCGCACLASVFQYWGERTSEAELLREFPGSKKHGYKLSDLKIMAISKGLSAHILAFDSDSKRKLVNQIMKGRPVICAVKYPRGLYFMYDLPLIGKLYREVLWMLGARANHYVVAFGWRDGRVLVMDPAFGYISHSWKRFKECWRDRKYAVLLCAKKETE